MQQLSVSRHGFADTRHGQVHYVEQGTGEPLLLLHQTPRSWDEYRDVLPLLADEFRVIAIDTLGYGESSCPSQPWSIQLFAEGVLDLCAHLGLSEIALVATTRVRSLLLRLPLQPPIGFARSYCRECPSSTRIAAKL